MSFLKGLSEISQIGRQGGGELDFGVINSEDFATNFGAWSTPGFEGPANPWQRGTGSTQTATGGPDGGADPTTRAVVGSNAYAHVEADDNGNDFTLESPELNSSQGTFTLRFDYHARFGSQGGIQDGTLLVQGYNGQDWVNIGPPIVGSKQAAAGDAYRRSVEFGVYDSVGFNNTDFRFRFRFQKGANQFQQNYDAAVDNITINGPGAVVVDPPDPVVPGNAGLIGGVGAAWNIPADAIGTHPNNTNLLNQVFSICPGRINMNFDKFTPVIFIEEEQGINTTATFVKTNNNFGGSLPPGSQVPWNEPKFVTSFDLDPSDSDSYFVLIRQSDGRCFEFFKADYVPGNNQIRAGRGTLLGNNIDEGGGNGNIFTKQNGNRDSRACGLQHAVGVPLRREFEAGGFFHCLPWAYPNPTQNAFKAPATKGAGFTGGGPNRGFMGLRIAWSGLTDNDINSWLNTQPGVARDFLRMMAVCARDFGFMVTDHGGNAGSQIGNTQIEHEISARWQADLGFGRSNIFQSLFSLLQPNTGKARALAEPNFINGSSQNASCYVGVNYPQGHPCNP